MDAFKDVMLSEPPSRIAAAPSAPTITAQPLSTFESYKGMLLCERPSHLLPRHHRDDVKPFIPAGLRRPQEEDRDPNVGLAPSVEERVHREVRKLGRSGTAVTKAASIVSRHKRWLRSFAASVKNMQATKVEEQIAAEARDRRLREREAQLRQERTQTDERGGGEAAPHAPSAAVAVAAATSERAAAPSTGKAARPMWALTEDEAFEAEVESTKGLLDFAKGLDYERYVADYEVQEALAILRDRVKEIRQEAEGGKQQEPDAHSDDVTSAGGGPPGEIRRPVVVTKSLTTAPGLSSTGVPPDGREEWNSSTNVGQRVRLALCADSLLLADKLLAQSEGLRQVHTKQSLARMLQDITLKESLGTRAEGAERLSQRVEPSLTPPLVSQVAAACTGLEPAGAPPRILRELRASKTHVQNLPYMYRCPSL